MASPIRIGTLDAAEARDLVQALAARGLIGKPVGDPEHRWVEVHETREETRRLLADVTRAVETWLRDHELGSLEIRVEDRVQRVAPQSDLPSTLQARLRTKRDGSERESG